jgi:hypothetical protein
VAQQCEPMDEDAPDRRAADDAQQTGAPAAPDAVEAAAAPGAPPAATANRMFAPDDAPKPAFGAASGWRAAMADGGAGAAPDAPAATADDPDATDADDADAADEPSPPPPASGDAVDIFMLDAHYEPAQPGSVFVIGKVRRGGEHVSACIAVHNIRQTLFVVPKPFVFQDADGDLAECGPGLAGLRMTSTPPIVHYLCSCHACA